MKKTNFLLEFRSFLERPDKNRGGKISKSRQEFINQVIGELKEFLEAKEDTQHGKDILVMKPTTILKDRSGATVMTEKESMKADERK